jgi:7,8-dihydroneopterin aldolase/epimerase/oxygenase
MPRPMDASTIFIHDFRVRTKIGVYAWEQHMPQTVRLDLEIGLADERAFASGKFAEALDYAKVVERLAAFAGTNPHPLLERFAEAIAEIVLGEFAASWVKVRVAKPAALPGVREIGVAIERHRAQN